jgi:hypothetical protein
MSVLEGDEHCASILKNGCDEEFNPDNALVEVLDDSVVSTRTSEAEAFDDEDCPFFTGAEFTLDGAYVACNDSELEFSREDNDYSPLTHLETYRLDNICASVSSTNREKNQGNDNDGFNCDGDNVDLKSPTRMLDIKVSINNTAKLADVGTVDTGAGEEVLENTPIPWEIHSSASNCKEVADCKCGASERKLTRRIRKMYISSSDDESVESFLEDSTQKIPVQRNIIRRNKIYLSSSDDDCEGTYDEETTSVAIDDHKYKKSPSHHCSPTTNLNSKFKNVENEIEQALRENSCLVAPMINHAIRVTKNVTATLFPMMKYT